MKKQTPKIIISPATEAAPVAAAEPTDAGVFGIHQVHQIRPSPDNRKRFNEVALQELAASIKSDGVAQPILIRPVSPTADAPEHYEIVAGERRWRASVIAGNVTIPAMVRPLTDLQAAKIRILENLQREDPHPLDEAEGYEQLMMRHGYNADQLADEIKKSRSYVYGRLKLCALSMDVREQFLDNKISASTALLIARIPVPALQVRALGEVVSPQTYPYTGEPLSYRRAAEYIQNHYMLDLADAVFAPGDAKLLASAGSCTKCPKRTGNQAEIFEDVKGADVCTDPDCFGEKKAAHFAITIVRANKQGIPVFEGDAAKDAINGQWSRSSDLVTDKVSLMHFDRNAPKTKNAGVIADILKDGGMPTPSAIAKKSDGSVINLYSRSAIQAALEKSGACETVKQHEERMKALEATPKGEAQAAQRQAEEKLEEVKSDLVERENKYRLALYKQLRVRAANGLSLSSLREFVKLIVVDFNDYSLPSDVLDVYQLEGHGDEAVCAYIDKATLPEIQLILLDLVLGECLQVSSWDVQDGKIDNDDQQERYDTLLAIARHEGINPDAVREELYPSPIVTDTMQYDDLVKFIRTSPARINELAQAVISDLKRFDLISAMERAAAAEGYTYGTEGYVKTPVTVDEPNVADTPRVIPPVKEQLQQQLAGKDKKTAMTKAVLAPATSWPFPKSRDQALAKDGESPVIQEPAEAPPAIEQAAV